MVRGTAERVAEILMGASKTKKQPTSNETLIDESMFNFIINSGGASPRCLRAFIRRLPIRLALKKYNSHAK